VGDEGNISSSQGNRGRERKLRAVLAGKRTGGRRRITGYRRSDGRFGALSSIPAVRVLSAGAGTEKCDFQGMFAIDQIEPLLLDDKRKGSMEAAVRRMLQRVPAFRARSWPWPGMADAPLDGACNDSPSFSTPVLKTRVHMGGLIRTSTGEKFDISRSFDL
ncbi:unnamed protein product, partial [Ectocarpus sp. 4 AP-2014]